MSARSDKLKKLEAELRDLEHWLNLGLVPNKDKVKHEAEIETIRQKIADEQNRLRFLKESGEQEEYVTPRKQPARTQYTEMPSLPEIDITEEAGASSESTEPEADNSLFETSDTDEKPEEESREEQSDEDDYFSDKNRWKRGMLHPNEDEW